MCFVLQLKTEPGLGVVMDGMNVKSLEERSEGDVASPSSTGTQVHKRSYSHKWSSTSHLYISVLAYTHAHAQI